MKKACFILFLVIASLLSSCSAPWVGVWHFEQNGNTIEFTSDGYMITNNAFERRERYTCDGSSLTYYANGQNVTVKFQIRKDDSGRMVMTIGGDGRSSIGRKVR
jgi:hypothetical protein